MFKPDCPLCSAQARSTALWQNQELRVIDAAEPDYPGFTRVIWHDHVAEMTVLNSPERRHIMDVVWVVEETLRKTLKPHKVNLAQLGNQVPHVHWHIIPRWPIDPRFPDAIWAPALMRPAEQQQAWQTLRTQVAQLIPEYHEALRDALESM